MKRMATTYMVIQGIDFEDTRVEPGDIVTSDMMTTRQISWLVESGSIEKVKAPEDLPDMTATEVKDAVEAGDVAVETAVKVEQAKPESQQRKTVLELADDDDDEEA